VTAAVIIAVVGGFALGVLIGAFVATRNAPRLIARLPAAERLAFARKVNRLARR
jgi:hypothetical protein